MAPFPFLELPTEVQLKIIREYLPALIVPEHKTPTSVFSLGERVTIDNLNESCDEIRVLIKSIRKLVGASEDVQFELDPERDMLLVWDMCLPKCNLSRIDQPLTPPVDVWLDAHALPIRRLLTVFENIMELANIDTKNELHIEEWCGHEFDGPEDVYEKWRRSPFATHLPIFCRFPIIEELALSVQIAPKVWHIDSFQMFGPDIVAPRNSNQGWGLARCGHDPVAAKYFADRGITADTGLEWKFRPSLYRYSSNEISQLQDLQKIDRNDNRTNYKPRIGLYGFSRGTMSQGGLWAGFRYYTDTGEVYFTPLSWSEVEHIVHRLSVPQGPVRVLPGNQDPQLIARLWIVRPSDKVPPNKPHHCWLKVKQWEEGDPEWVSGLMTM
ncbi:hypothetical protein FHETE_862 [Fusarium heterosporum]|uniref:Uncharacterized protein n=1 Tax=Fusarium heterosporum TaxID=42747 RepID=A0A8H5X219_FUSHE|nr:hypothetical protein FHETE_862 [Fusarium heterosporum]